MFAQECLAAENRLCRLSFGVNLCSKTSKNHGRRTLRREAASRRDQKRIGSIGVAEPQVVLTTTSSQLLGGDIVSASPVSSCSWQVRYGMSCVLSEVQMLQKGSHALQTPSRSDEMNFGDDMYVPSKIAS